jgi:hypothetical protein
LIVEAGGEELSVGGVLIRPEGPQRLSGLGDVSVSAGRLLPVALPVDVAIQLQLKLPTGSSSFSTGMVDGGLDVELSKDFGGVSPFVSAGYRFYGDDPDFELENGWVASAGASLTHGRLTLIASYDWSQSPIGLPDAHEIFFVASGPLAARWNWSLFGSKGLNDGAADVMVGMGLMRSLSRKK